MNRAGRIHLEVLVVKKQAIEEGNVICRKLPADYRISQVS